MKSVKGKLLKKLKTIKTIGYIKAERFLQVNASDGYFQPPKSTQFQNSQKDTILVRERSSKELEPEIIDVSELMGDLEDEELDEKENIRPETVDINRESSISDPEKGEIKAVESNQGLGERDFVYDESESDVEFNQKENIFSELGDRNRVYSLSAPDPEKRKSDAAESRYGGERNNPLSEIDVSTFRRPDLNSGSLFDPNLLEAFKQAVIEFKAQEAVKRARIKEKEKHQALIGIENEEPPLKSRKLDFQDIDPLFEFEKKLPPGGSDSVILYTTSLRSIRKTFEDCHCVRFLLESFRVLFFERDISMHLEFREELWRIMGERLVPPCLFIRGRYIGGAERVLALHEQGKLRPLFVGVPMDRAEGPCGGCGGARFVVCFSCSGSRKAVVCDDVAVAESCLECNENGLIVCSLCC